MRLSDIKAGDTIIADGGFTCMASGPKKVMEDKSGCLYVQCNKGGHYLDGQEDAAGELVGISRAPEPAAA